MVWLGFDSEWDRDEITIYDTSSPVSKGTGVRVSTTGTKRTKDRRKW